METWQKEHIFTGHISLADSPISIYFVLELNKVDMRLKKKKKMKFYKETLKKTLIILYTTKNK